MSNLYSYLILNDSGRLLIINEAISKNIQNIIDFFIGVGIGNANVFQIFFSMIVLVQIFSTLIIFTLNY